MKKNGVLIIVIIAISISAFLYYLFFYKKPEGAQLIVEDVGPKELSVEKSIEENFRLEIPEDIDKTELKKNSNEEGMAIATREVVAGKFVLTVLANVPDGDYYAALVRGNPSDDNFGLIPAGQLRLAKGGYLIEFQSSEDLSDYKRIVVSKTPITTSIPQELVFDGSF